MRESLRIIKYCLDFIPEGEVKCFNEKLISPSRVSVRSSMESLIHHFVLTSKSHVLPSKELYMATEAPKGEFGLYISSNSNNCLERVKIRAPGFYHLQGLKCMAPLHLLADVVTIIGTQDIVFGEVDR
jgi:NADH:ubiquinone oxidoreductase subunit D